jgi:hypothetical protein
MRHTIHADNSSAVRRGGRITPGIARNEDHNAGNEQFI